MVLNMEDNDKSQDIHVNNYTFLLSQNETGNIYKSLDIQRKCLAQLYEASCNSLSNANLCELLEYRLQNYTNIVYKQNNNVYNELLKKAFPKIALERQLKVNEQFPKIDFNSYLKKLRCPNGQPVFCEQSETIGQSELEQFQNLFKKRNNSTSESKSLPISTIPEKDTALQTRFKNLDKLQGRFETYSDPRRSSNKQINLNLDAFHTARDELQNQMLNKAGSSSAGSLEDSSTGIPKRQLGTRRSVTSKFVSPLLSRSRSEDEENNQKAPMDERLKNIEPKMIELIMCEIMDQNPNIDWNDIAGLCYAKATIKEAVVWPMLRPDIFTGLRKPPKGILLFGPPGTGKTLIGKCVASQSKSTFFSISASSLMSKWIGESEKMVRALFAVARVHQPSVIFIDEVDSLLTQRTEGEHESTRRIKTEFLVQLDGATIKNEDRVLVIGATNRPQELDEAARRRFVKRLYIPLPEFEGRYELVKKLICNERHSLANEEFVKIAQLAEGYSGADIKNLCSEAALEPLRAMDLSAMEKIEAADVRPLMFDDFCKALSSVKPSVSQTDLIEYIQWDKTYGSRSS